MKKLFQILMVCCSLMIPSSTYAEVNLISDLPEELLDHVLASTSPLDWPNIARTNVRMNQWVKFGLFRRHALSKLLNSSEFIQISPGSLLLDEGTRRARIDDIEFHKFKVSQLLWYLVMLNEVEPSLRNPSEFKKPEHCPKSYLKINDTELCFNFPVENITWNEVTHRFFPKLNQIMRDQAKTSGIPDYEYLLASSDEWQATARYGLDPQAQYICGAAAHDHIHVSDYAWYCDNSTLDEDGSLIPGNYGKETLYIQKTIDFFLGPKLSLLTNEGEKAIQRHYSYRTHQLGTKKPNPLGIYDLCGNVWEMTRDDSSTKDQESQQKKVIVVGGSYFSYKSFTADLMTPIGPDSLALSSRGNIGRNEKNSELGFRIIRRKVDRSGK